MKSKFSHGTMQVTAKFVYNQSLLQNQSQNRIQNPVEHLTIFPISSS